MRTWEPDICPNCGGTEVTYTLTNVPVLYGADPKVFPESVQAHLTAKNVPVGDCWNLKCRFRWHDWRGEKIMDDTVREWLKHFEVPLPGRQALHAVMAWTAWRLFGFGGLWPRLGWGPMRRTTGRFWGTSGEVTREGDERRYCNALHRWMAGFDARFPHPMQTDGHPSTWQVFPLGRYMGLPRWRRVVWRLWRPLCWLTHHPWHYDGPHQDGGYRIGVVCPRCLARAEWV